MTDVKATTRRIMATAEHEPRIRKLIHELIDATAARDMAAHGSALQAARDHALRIRDAASEAANAARHGSGAALAEERAAQARIAPAVEAVRKAEAELERVRKSGTPEQETAAREKVDGLARTLQARQQAAVLADEQERTASAMATLAVKAEADAQRALDEAQAALDKPGRAPVSEATTDIIGLWYALWPRVEGLPELTDEEQSHRRYRLHRAWLATPEPFMPTYGDPRIIAKVG